MRRCPLVSFSPGFPKTQLTAVVLVVVADAVDFAITWLPLEITTCFAKKGNGGNQVIGRAQG